MLCYRGYFQKVKSRTKIYFNFKLILNVINIITSVIPYMRISILKFNLLQTSRKDFFHSAFNHGWLNFSNKFLFSMCSFYTNDWSASSRSWSRGRGSAALYERSVSEPPVAPSPQGGDAQPTAPAHPRHCLWKTNTHKQISHSNSQLWATAKSHIRRFKRSQQLQTEHTLTGAMLYSLS